MKKYDVITVGLQCIDLVSSVVPRGILDRELTIVDSIVMMLGGDALNQAVVLSALGANVGLMGLAGTDRLGDILMAQLSQYPITVLNRRADVPTTISQVLIDENHERHFVYQPGTNNAFSYSHIDEDAIRSAKYVSIGGCFALPALDGDGMIRLLDLASQAGAKTVLDFRDSVGDADRDLVRALFARADYIVPSQQEVKCLAGEADTPEGMLENLRALGAGNCIIKLGEKGCLVSADGFEGVVPTYPCKCIDTTGAGDNFVGAFLYAKTQDWDIIKCAQFANAAGSIAVEHIGANSAIHSVEQVLNRMQGIS